MCSKRLQSLASSRAQERAGTQKGIGRKITTKTYAKGDATLKNDCLFCAIIDGEIPSKKVYEDEQCYAFYDIEPQAPVHFLVVPKAHICCANAITADNSGVVAHCFEVIAKICRELGVESYRIVNNCGDQAGQTVKHLHFHVLAGRDMTWPPG